MGRASMHVEETQSNIRTGSPKLQQYDFTRTNAHVFSKLYMISPREGEKFNLRTLHLNFKGAKILNKIGE